MPPRTTDNTDTSTTSGSIKWASKDPSVSINFVKAALAGAKKNGADIPALLSSAGIELELMEEAKARVSPDQYTRLIRAIWKATEDEFIGLANVKSPPGTFSMMCLAIIHSENLREAVNRANRFYSLFGNDMTLELSEDGDKARLAMHVKGLTDEPIHFLVECGLVILHRFACWLIGERIIIDRAFFNYPEPHHSDEYKGIFCSNIEFDQPATGLEFDSRYLDIQPKQDERTLKEYLKHSPANLVTKPQNDSSYTAQVRALLNDESESKFPPLETIADKLNTTPSTLRRRLKAENTSYQIIKDSIRRDIAIHLLTETDQSLSQISEQLGYTEASAFQHTFKKWTGLSPGAYRGNR